VLRGHYTQVNSCYFDQESHELFTGANDRNILMWTPKMDRAYEQHLTDLANNKKEEKRPGFTSRIAATADAWSSDED
jgi:DNA excision repair protein ERCC-8